MKLRLKIKKLGMQFLCEFKLDETSFYLKTDDLDSLFEILDVQLGTSLLGTESESPIQNEFIKEFEIADHRFTIGAPESLENAEFTKQQWITQLHKSIGRTVIPFPLPNNVSKEGKPFVFSHSPLGRFAKVWEKGNHFALYKTLSEDLLELPYVDNPDDRIEVKDQIAFHPNHGTTHAIRQALFSRNYLRYLRTHGTSQVKEVINNLTEEQRSCLELAAFLFRSGRTNERGWNSDDSYGARSATIFSHIAAELDFEPELIKLLSASFDYHQPLEIDASLTNETLEETQLKAALFRSILMISHECDLVRCDEDIAPVQQKLKNTLQTLINNPDNLDNLIDDILTYSAELNRKTGSPITAKAYRQNDSEVGGNKFIAIAAAHSPQKVLENLSLVQFPYADPYVPPTDAWLQNEEHVYYENGNLRFYGHHTKGGAVTKFIPSEPWTEAQISTIPTFQCIEKEREHLESHVVVYHATKKANYALDLLCRALADADDQTAWLRTSRTAGKSTIENIDRAKDLSASTVDNKDFMAWNLLSCSPTLWQNTDYASEESTVDYFYNFGSSREIDFDSLINKVLDERKLLLGNDAARQRLYEQFKNLVADEQYGTQGVIYQYFIPHHLVNEVAYISLCNGEWDQRNQDALQALIQLKSPDGKVPNQGTMQVRLLVSKLLDLTIVPSLVVYNHLNLSETLKTQFHTAVQNIAKIALENVSVGCDSPMKESDREYLATPKKVREKEESSGSPEGIDEDFIPTSEINPQVSFTKSLSFFSSKKVENTTKEGVEEEKKEDDLDVFNLLGG